MLRYADPKRYFSPFTKTKSEINCVISMIVYESPTVISGLSLSFSFYIFARRFLPYSTRSYISCLHLLFRLYPNSWEFFFKRFNIVHTILIYFYILQLYWTGNKETLKTIIFHCENNRTKKMLNNIGILTW